MFVADVETISKSKVDSIERTVNKTEKQQNKKQKRRNK